MASLSSLRLRSISASNAQILTVAIVITLAFSWLAARVHQRGASGREELSRSRLIRSGLTLLARRYAPVTRAESLSFKRAADSVWQLGVTAGDRLGITEELASRAELAGLVDVRAVIVESDTTPAPERQSMERVQLRPASYAVAVEFRGGFDAVLAFLRTLPPSVAVKELTVRMGSERRSRIVFAVYEIDRTNAASLIAIPPDSRAVATRAGGGVRVGSLDG